MIRGVAKDVSEVLFKEQSCRGCALMAGRDSDCHGKQGGARPGKQREETALHPDPETGRERGERGESKKPPSHSPPQCEMGKKTKQKTADKTNMTCIY